MNHDEIARMSASEMRRLIGTKELSATDIAQACLHRYEKLNGEINAVCSLADGILETAKELDNKAARGEELGLLHGLPFGIKDVTETAGLRTTYGSPMYADNVPTEDALVVQRLKAAGGILFGKTNTPEFATGGNTFNEVFGRTCNPWDKSKSAGGSTGGGAAGLASGMIALAEGTDLGGSLRIPASFCGIVGLRPSPGLVPTYPSNFLWDDMQVSGIMGRTAEDIALGLQATAGPSPLSPRNQPTAGRDFVGTVAKGLGKGLRIAYCPDISGIGIDPEVDKVCRETAFELANNGHTVEEIEFDLSYGWKPFLHIRGYWMIAQQYPRLERVEEMGSNLAGNVQAGLKVTMEELGYATNTRGQMWHHFYQFFQKYDFLLTPCMVIPPFPVTDNYPETIAGKKMKNYIDWVASTFILSLTGLPVGSVPSGLTSGNLPAGLQIVGPQLGEERVLALAKEIQTIRPIGLPTL